MTFHADQLFADLESFFYNIWEVEEVAQHILDQEPELRAYVFSWVTSIAKTQPEMAFQYAARVKTALREIGREGAEQWVQSALDTYFSSGLYPANQVIKNLDDFIAHYQRKQKGSSLNDVRSVLENFLHGLSGRPLRIQSGDAIYCDTETLFLPEVVDASDDARQNFNLFKAMAAHQWAQTWYGTWLVDIEAVVQDYANRIRATRLLHHLETIRLNACIGRDLPGLLRQMQGFENESFHSYFPQECVIHLSASTASVRESLVWLDKLYADAPDPSLIYQGELRPEQVNAVIAARRIREKDLFRLALAKMADEMGRLDEREDDAEKSQTDDQTAGPQFDKKSIADPDQPQGFSYELELDGNPAIPNEETRSLMDSIIQDQGEIPDDYLTAAGPGEYHVWKAQQQEEQDPDAVWKGTYHEEGAFLYDEWDCTRRAHRKNWCALREKEIKPDHDSSFVADTLHQYRGLSKSLRRSFEAMRDENKILKKQPYGEDLDIDALVNSLADVKSGMELSSRIYTKAHRAERNIAVIFMIDMSGSTRGWINTAQREALILLCEALESLGDRYAIYGFSGMTRKRCELYRVKSFDDRYDDDTRARIAAIEPQDYTRMGVTIRHLTRLFQDIEARTKLLITLSDGKPDDYDSYHGEYGIEDTRMSLFEARLAGIHPFCITIDETARDYLPHMYGHANYVLIDDVKKLPYKISDIYRKLTA